MFMKPTPFLAQPILKRVGDAWEPRTWLSWDLKQKLNYAFMVIARANIFTLLEIKRMFSACQSLHLIRLWSVLQSQPRKFHIMLSPWPYSCTFMWMWPKQFLRGISINLQLICPTVSLEPFTNCSVQFVGQFLYANRHLLSEFVGHEVASKCRFAVVNGYAELLSLGMCRWSHVCIGGHPVSLCYTCIRSTCILVCDVFVCLQASCSFRQRWHGLAFLKAKQVAWILLIVVSLSFPCLAAASAALLLFPIPHRGTWAIFSWFLFHVDSRW